MRAATAWGLGLGTGVAGIAGAAAGHDAGPVLAAAGAGLLLARLLRGALAPGHRSRARAAGVAAAGALAALGLGLAAQRGLDGAAVVALALGAQAVLAVAGRGPPGRPVRLARQVFPLLGHASATLATVGVAQAGPGSAAGLAYASGFAVLALHAFWVRRAADPGAGDAWEPALLAALLAGLGAATAAQLDATGAAWARGLAGPAVWVGAGGALVALGALAAPPRAPRWLARPGVLPRVAAHGAASIALLNVLFLAFSVVAGWSLRAVVLVLLAWQGIAVTMEYRAIRHAERLRRAGPPADEPPAVTEPVTVMVTACDEAEVLPRSLAHNLQLPGPLQFLLVPATKSTDGTVACAHALAARHPGRVRVVEGTTGSKAEDLNLAWGHVATEHVLILDADETIDARSLALGLDVLRRCPEVGVVQGRKVARDPEATLLGRFVSAERRYSTRMDHPFHADTFGSSHFAGSAALLRREVPLAVGGWTPRTLTEDIEFSLRLHLETPWRIAYVPRMVVRESDPADLAALVRQRTRWARGWTECFLDYFPEVLRRRESLGAKRARGLAWLLLTPVSALWTTLLPAMLLLRLAGLSMLPALLALPLTLLVLPSRLLAYGYASLRDPVIPLARRPARVAELALFAYGWIVSGGSCSSTRCTSS